MHKLPGGTRYIQPSPTMHEVQRSRMVLEKAILSTLYLMGVKLIL